MFYVGTVWHGGGANRTDERRLGVILEYAASWLRAQENHVTAVPVDVMRTLARGSRSCSGTTSSRRSSATSTAATRGEPSGRIAAALSSPRTNPR